MLSDPIGEIPEAVRLCLARCRSRPVRGVKRRMHPWRDFSGDVLFTRDGIGKDREFPLIQVCNVGYPVAIGSEEQKHLLAKREARASHDPEVHIVDGASALPQRNLTDRDLPLQDFLDGHRYIREEGSPDAIISPLNRGNMADDDVRRVLYKGFLGEWNKDRCIDPRGAGQGEERDKDERALPPVSG